MKTLKNILLGCMFSSFFFFYDIKGQNLPIVIDFVGQKTDQWCWAASIEMINKYYATSNLSQCHIVDEFNFITDFPRSTSLVNLCSIAGCPNQNHTALNDNIFSIPINISSSAVNGSLGPSYFDLLFSALGFNSIEDFNLLSWEEYKTEIQSCRPVILQYDADDASDSINISSHSVLAIGYRELIQDTFFVINDPWNPCIGATYWLNAKILSGNSDKQNNLLISKVYSNVYHIAPKGVTCNTCNLINERENTKRTNSRQITENINISAIDRAIRINNEKFIGTSVSGEKLNTEVINSFLKEGSHYKIPVFNLSYNLLSKEENKEVSNLEQLYTYTEKEKTISEIILPSPESNENLCATIHCNSITGRCITEKISLIPNEENQTIIFPNDEKVILSNNSNNSKSFIPYSIVRFLPYTAEFYRFQDKEGKFFFYPKRINAPSPFLEESISGRAIPEQEAIKKLREYPKIRPFKVKKLKSKETKFGVGNVINTDISPPKNIWSKIKNKLINFSLDYASVFMGLLIALLIYLLTKIKRKPN